MSGRTAEKPQVRHAKSTSNPDWPYESYCVGCGQEWPCNGEHEENEELCREHDKLQEALDRVHALWPHIQKG